MKKIFWALVVFLFFIPLSFPIIYANSPKVDEELQILIENAGNSTILLISPNGRRIQMQLQDGQLDYFVGMEGKWIIEYENERKEVDVGAKANENMGKKKEEGNAYLFFAQIMLGSALLVLIALVLLAAIAIVFPPAPRKGTSLSRTREGSAVMAKFCAGSRPVENAKLVDEAGSGWKKGGMKMSAKKLDAFKCLEIKYEYGGPLGSAHAEWEEEGERKRLEVREGIAFEEIKGEFGIGRGKNEKAEKEIGKRKLIGGNEKISESKCEKAGAKNENEMFENAKNEKRKFENKNEIGKMDGGNEKTIFVNKKRKLSKA